METFTPLFDEITQQHGIITAAVYGYIWRKCQGEMGVCCASLQTMAGDLNVSRRTIVTHVKLLVSDKLITDLTPNADRKPHKYLVQNMQQTREVNALDENATREINAWGGAANALALGQEMQQTREINAHKDTYTKRDNRRDKENIYIHPLPEPIQELITAICQTVKTGYAPKTEDDFEATAYMLAGWDVDPGNVNGFGDWWKTNGYYPGKPALKSLADEFRNYLDGITISRNQNGANANGRSVSPAENALAEYTAMKQEFINRE